MKIQSGFININKPLNLTSSDVVVKVRRVLNNYFKEKTKVGHLGTLDPLAEGVLPIAFGRATRLFDFAQKKQKTYQAVFSFGKTTDTLDSAGEVTSECDTIPTESQIIKVLECFQGVVEQVPPKYSAKSIGGVRAYKLARENKEFTLAPKEVEIFHIKLVEQVDKSSFSFEICCGSGCYIRSLARDIASTLDTVGYMKSLKRISSGEFTIESSVTVEHFQEAPQIYMQSCGILLDELPNIILSSSQEKALLHGQKLNLNLPQGYFRVETTTKLLGLGQNVNSYLKMIWL